MMNPTVPVDLSRAATAELRKITTLRAGWLLLPVSAVVGFVITAAAAALGHGPVPHDAVATGTASTGLYVALALTAAAAAVFAVLGAGGEYRYRTMPLTVLCTPDRDLMVGAKFAVTAVYSLLLAVATEVGAVLGLLALGRHKFDVGLRLVTVLGGGLLAVLCWGLIGAALGLLLRATVPAIAALIGWLLVIEPLIWLVVKGAGIPGAAVLLPGSATIGTVMTGSFQGSALIAPSAASAVVLLLWTGAAGSSAWWYLRQRDI
jgi:ABC-2 type transport system permease protein